MAKKIEKKVVSKESGEEAGKVATVSEKAGKDAMKRESLSKDKKAFEAFILGGYSEEALNGIASGLVLPGVALPALSAEVLFQSTVLPFERVIFLAGLPGHCKTLLSLNIAKWFRDAGGLCVYVDTENKMSPNVLLSQLGTGYGRWFRSLIAKSINQAQSFLTWSRNNYEKVMAKPKPYPILEVFDSIMGSDAESVIEDVVKSGSAKKTYSASALLTASYVRSYVSRLSHQPANAIFVTHVKQLPQVNKYSKLAFELKGAKQLGFGSTYVLIPYISSTDKNLKLGTALHGFIMIDKGGVLQDSRVPLMVTFKPNPNIEAVKAKKEPATLSEVEWDAMTTLLLTEVTKYRWSPTIRSIVSDHFNVTRSPTGVVDCAKFGIKKGTDADFNQALRENPKALEDIRTAFSIFEGVPMLKGSDYKDVRREANIQSLKYINME